jgi:hypothetical protein
MKIHRGRMSSCAARFRLGVSAKSGRNARDRRGHRKVALRDGALQMRSGKRVMKLSRLGIFTFGSVSAFIASLSPMSLLRASR